MITVIFGLGLIGTSLIGLLLIRLYSSVPVRELKLLAREGDAQAAALYRVAAYGSAARAVLQIIAGACGAVGLGLLLAEGSPVSNAAILLLYAGLVWAVSIFGHLSVNTVWLPVWLSGIITKVTSVLYDPLAAAIRRVNRLRDVRPHTRLYDAHDLDELLTTQVAQHNNRIHSDDLELLRRALHMRSRTAKDVLVSKKEMLTINADDSIGPLLLDQMHRHGQDSYLVYKDTKDNFIGTLRLSDAVSAKTGGRVLDFVRPELQTIRETSSLHHILDVLRSSGHQLVVVVNEFDDLVGMVTLEGLMSYLFDKRPVAPEAVTVESENEVDESPAANDQEPASEDPSPEP